MTRTKRLALAFYVGAVAAGAAGGITVDRWILRERLVNRWEDPRAARDEFASRLGMDATQRVALDTILDDRNRQIDALMAPVEPQADSIHVATRQKIRSLLTPEQQATYDEMQREREAARQKQKEKKQ